MMVPMKTFTYKDLRAFLLNSIYKKKYYELAVYLKKVIGEGKDINLFEYLDENGDKIILTAKNEKELNKKIRQFIRTKFKLMKFGIFDEIKSKLDDIKKF